MRDRSPCDPSSNSGLGGVLQVPTVMGHCEQVREHLSGRRVSLGMPLFALESGLLSGETDSETLVASGDSAEPGPGGRAVCCLGRRVRLISL